MGCGSTPKVFNIVSATSSGQKAASSTTRKKARIESVKPYADWHCPKCGLTVRNKSDKQNHNCDPSNKVSYQETRKAICTDCPHRQGDVCSVLKTLHPDRPCKISVGVTNPSWRCPVGNWERTVWVCNKPSCKAISFDENGLKACPKCSPQCKPKCPIHNPDGSACNTTSSIYTPPKSYAPIRLPFDKPSSPNCIVSIAVGQAMIDIAKITHPIIQRYAERIGVDFIPVYDNRCPTFPHTNKYRLPSLTMYRRCLYLDADLLFDPHTLPDLFSEFPEGKVWAYNDVHNNPEKMQWLIDEYDRLIVEQQLEDRRSEVDAVKERWCYNTGVILWDTRFSSFLWNPPSHPLVIAPTVEQTWVNINIALSNIPVEPLPIEYNIQPWMFDFHKRLPEAKIVHYSSLDAKRKLFELQKRALQCLAQ